MAKVITQIAGLDVAAKYDIAGNNIVNTYATLADLNAAKVSAVEFMGSVAYASLPTNLTADDKGHLYNVTDAFGINSSGTIVSPSTSGATVYDAGTNLLWTGTGWDVYGSAQMTVDTAFSTTSTAPLQNKVITAAINNITGGVTVVGHAATATNIDVAPSMSYTIATASANGQITVTVGDKTSTAIDIGKVKDAFNADSAVDSTYATKIGTSTTHPAIGNATRPVYIDGTGAVALCTSYADATVKEAGKATNDSEGNSIVDTYATKAELEEKQSTIEGAASSVVDADLTANKVLISNSNGKIATSTMNSSDLGKLTLTDNGTDTLTLSSFAGDSLSFTYITVE